MLWTRPFHYDIKLLSADGYYHLFYSFYLLFLWCHCLFCYHLYHSSCINKYDINEMEENRAERDLKINILIQWQYSLQFTVCAAYTNAYTFTNNSLIDFYLSLLLINIRLGLPFHSKWISKRRQSWLVTFFVKSSNIAITFNTNSLQRVSNLQTRLIQ